MLAHVFFCPGRPRLALLARVPAGDGVRGTP